ncbi:hypothetical protein BD626DRAFT_509485 [Schizophyllum amplum]|uniref:Uncharacterized protein n=1 Tax=Schizophyllum amplum TaxID=97359 RepID=A0A550C2J2_9AGAR|nr:hypothetical protein BD626DRAFT_509485 [Auriculariopsis ampla]
MSQQVHRQLDQKQTCEWQRQLTSPRTTRRQTATSRHAGKGIRSINDESRCNGCGNKACAPARGSYAGGKRQAG